MMDNKLKAALAEERKAAFAAITRLQKQIAKVEKERGVLEEFVKEFVDAWESGMGGNSYLLRGARKALAQLEEK
jgi:transposase